MSHKGIRILDKKDSVVSVELADILKEIKNGSCLEWSILYLQATGDLGEGQSIPVFEKEIYDSEKGLFIAWDDLNLLSKKFWQVIDITLIGSKDGKILHRYDNDRDMYEMCDIVIEMIDSSYWEVFSKDGELINRLAAKFKETKFLETDFKR